VHQRAAQQQTAHLIPDLLQDTGWVFQESSAPFELPEGCALSARKPDWLVLVQKLCSRVITTLCPVH